MFHDAGDVPGGDGASVGDVRRVILVGKIQAVEGAVSISRTGTALVGQAVAGDCLYQGDRIETGPEGDATVFFTDGTTFHLYPGTQLVLDEFVYGDEQSSNSAAFRVGKGKFGFIAGKAASTGRFVVHTPHSTIRSAAPVGIGATAFLLMLCVIREAEAQSEVGVTSEEFKSLLDPEDLTAADLYHGIYEVLIDGVVNIVDKPDEALVAWHRGAGVVVERVKHSSQQMSDLQSEFGKVASYFKLAQQDPFLLQIQKAANQAGSSTFASAFDVQQFTGLIANPYTPVVYSPPPPPPLPTIPPGDTTGGIHVTYPAQFVLLPIGNNQQPGTNIFLGPFVPDRDVNIPPDGVAIVSLTIPSGQTLVSVQIYDLPRGDKIIANNITYLGGGPGTKITIPAADFYLTGLLLERHTTTTTTIYLTATVLGLGGPLKSSKSAGALELTSDVVVWTDGGHDQDWNNPNNWSTIAVPLPFQDVSIPSGHNYVVNVSSANVSIDSLFVGSDVTLNIANGRTFSLDDA